MYAWYKTLNLAFFHLTTYLGDHIVSASSGCFNRMPQMGWFNTHLFHRVLEARDQGASAVRFLMRTLLLAGRWSPFLVSSYDRAEREKVSFVSSCKDMNFILRAPPLRPNCLLMAPLLNTIISRIRLWHTNFGGTYSVYSMYPYPYAVCFLFYSCLCLTNSLPIGIQVVSTLCWNGQLFAEKSKFIKLLLENYIRSSRSSTQKSPVEPSIIQSKNENPSDSLRCPVKSAPTPFSAISPCLL